MFVVSYRLFYNIFQKTSKNSYPQNILLEGTGRHQPLITGKSISVEIQLRIEKYITSNGLKAHFTVPIEHWIMSVENQNQGIQ